MENILITGGYGFIGGHLVDELVNLGYKVYIIDNLSTGNPKNVRSNEAIFLGKKINETLTKEMKFNYIFHLGFPSSSPMYKENKLLVSKSIKDLLHILEYARKHNSKIILASTSSIYNGNPIPWREDMPVLVSDFYSETRFYSERLCELYSKLYGTECIVLRYFSVYGEREEYKGKYANVLTQIIWAGLRNEEFIIYGDGTQTRDLIYVKDVINTNIKAMLFDNYSQDIKFEIFNVGTGKSYSFNDLIVILRKYGLTLKIEYVENPIKNYVYHTLADTKKSRELLKFSPRHSLDDVLPSIIEYYKNILLK